MIAFHMPTLGADMEAGTLVEWLKKPGDVVARGDIIAVVDTEKGAIEIEVFDSGVIDRLLIEPGQKTPVGTILAMIRAPGEPPGVALEPVAGAPPPWRHAPGSRPPRGRRPSNSASISTPWRDGALVGRLPSPMSSTPSRGAGRC
jgi:pyruvate dehydrogenase E2 component (dihydrolipoamide acetyltransferase)